MPNWPGHPPTGPHWQTECGLRCDLPPAPAPEGSGLFARRSEGPMPGRQKKLRFCSAGFNPPPGPFRYKERLLLVGRPGPRHNLSRPGRRDQTCSVSFPAGAFLPATPGRSYLRQIRLKLVVGHLRAIVVPLDLLVRHELLEDVIAQRLANEFTFLQQIDGVSQISRQ